jgi:putative tricarboxylic transport membrane protein
MIFAALMIQGITPGPFLVAEHPDVFWGVIASMYIGNGMLLVLNLPMVGIWVQMLRVPYGILAPIIVLFTTIGVYSVQNQVFDIYSMLFFAALGYGMRKLDFDPAPLPLAFVLGPMVERSLRQSLLISGGDLTIFVSRPISGTLIAIFLLLIVGQTAFFIKRKMRGKKTAAT